ncbi:hypothetical protein FOI68_14650 [Brevibacillus sp. LEMMJ03]|uniref:hypothetical protein n=1 Tax=Brevibacillus sp. LEMMJ03 TaxID=2595056 RepID=UPI00117E8762|nr:hypothetical protein [Brevibacillus sp. LEMMJ03]TRY24779.1 hypothetical protein FOI68_14650 [Brevibacillus sp. LEMMJ03]
MGLNQSNHSIDKFTSQLSAHIWGHRFKEGQRGPEYVLEFLNVLYGTDYNFDAHEYKQRKSVSLRKFIFQGVKEGSVRDIVTLKEAELEKLKETFPDENNLTVLRKFLRSLEVELYNVNGEEADRSWYARTLYPLHESLLFFELRKKESSQMSIERNFFARGGELYFLMLAYGTEENDVQRRFIEERFRELLNKNKMIYRVVESIQSALGEKEDHADKKYSKLRSSIQNEENVPYLPDTRMPIFKDFADELALLLQNDVDIYELFRLLVSLVCFQLTRYMHVRAQDVGEKDLLYFFDCLDGLNTHVTQLSAQTFKEHENLIKKRFEKEFERKYKEAVGNTDSVNEKLNEWKNDTDAFFKRLGLDKLRTAKKVIESVLKSCNSENDLYGRLYDVVKDVVSNRLKKDQLNITRVLTRDGGLATYRRGSGVNYRYTISDTFIQSLVFTMVGPGKKMEFHAFLHQIYQRFGIVIGEVQARQSGLYERSRLNVRYFQENEKALREKLRRNGLLVEYSDATAMIRNPYSPIKRMEEVSYA